MEIKLALVAVLIACLFSRFMRQLTFAAALAGIAVGGGLAATGHSLPTGISVAEIVRAFHATY